MIEFKQIKPWGHRVLALLEPVEARQLDSGVWIPLSHSEIVRMGEVLDVGGDVSKFKKGDKILVNYTAGLPITHTDIPSERDTLRIMNESEILALITEE